MHFLLLSMQKYFSAALLPVGGPYEFPESSPVPAFSLPIWKTSRCPPVNKNKTTYVLSLADTNPYISKKHIPPKILLHFVLLHFALLSCITFCVKSYYILRYRRCYILRRKSLHFALLLDFVAKVITFCVTITFCVSYYILWRNRDINDGSNKESYCPDGESTLWSGHYK